MNICILAAIAGLCLCFLLAAGVSRAETDTGVKTIPLDDKGLAKLDQKQLHLARKAGTVCVHLSLGGTVMRGSAPVPLDGCNITQLDHLVTEANDPALSAYHNALRPRMRYDQNRSSMYWRTVRLQLLANNPELTAPAGK